MTPQLTLYLGAALWIAIATLLAFAAFGIDKQLARDGSRRIPERTLLLLALFGGTLGAFAGQRMFPHKTQKEPFRSLLIAIAVLQATLLLAWLFQRDLLALLPLSPN